VSVTVFVASTIGSACPLTVVVASTIGSACPLLYL
jgi:hypothetical protein